MANEQRSAEEIFGAALELSSEQRGAYLDASCGSFSELRREVDALLLDHERLGDFLTNSPLTPAIVSSPQVAADSNNALLTAGRKLGRFTIVAPLGAGGMGAVYQARDERLERVVAIKVLSPELFHGSESRNRFRKEALALARLSHANIAAVYDVGEEGDIDYIVIECIVGQTLAAKLKLGPLPIAEALSIAQQVACALEEAHELGVIHRDLKPANIMVTTRGNVKVLDFGIAKLAALETTDPAKTGDAATLIGTPLYMSPEQVQGKKVDTRTDLWSLGVVLYETITGRSPFHRESSFAIMHAIVEQPPASITQLRPDTPPAADRIVTRLLQKVPTARYQTAKQVAQDTATAITAITHPTLAPYSFQPIQPAPQLKSPARKALYIAAAILFTLIILTTAFLIRRSTPISLPTSAQWEQLTYFTDSAVYPTLSSDGRMLAFIRGSNSFLGPGDIYVKLLPSGQPVQLTHDARVKLAPAFTPDDSNIVYSIVDPWDTWEVPVLGGRPHLLLPNASSLSWIDKDQHLLFSEIKEGLHLAVITSDQARGNSRDVYVPVGNRSMAHHSYLSPDGKWVLIVEMNSRAEIIPCRVVPFQGRTEVRVVGPLDGPCRAGAWSPDGKWIYLTVKDTRTDDFHLWRQHFPDGAPEQITFGPTSQEGIAMATDGRSLITSVGSTDHTVWLHDKDGDHQISSEGDATSPLLSPDGRSLYFLMANGQTHGAELWVKDLTTGTIDRLLPGYEVQRSSIGRESDYSLSPDGKEIAFAMDDPGGRSSIWVVPTNHRSAPRHITSSTAEDAPFFLPNGELLFRAMEGGSNFLYRMKPDGTDRRKVIPDRILELMSVSPDGRWVVTAMQDSDEQYPASVKSFTLDGTASLQLCIVECHLTWDPTEKFAYLNLAEISDHSFVLPLTPNGLPKFPPTGIASEKDLANAKTIPAELGSALSPSVYAYTRENTRRNLYRIPLP